MPLELIQVPLLKKMLLPRTPWHTEQSFARGEGDTWTFFASTLKYVHTGAALAIIIDAMVSGRNIVWYGERDKMKLFMAYGITKHPQYCIVVVYVEV